MSLQKDRVSILGIVLMMFLVMGFVLFGLHTIRNNAKETIQNRIEKLKKKSDKNIALYNEGKTLFCIRTKVKSKGGLFGSTIYDKQDFVVSQKNKNWKLEGHKFYNMEASRFVETSACNL